MQTGANPEEWRSTSVPVVVSVTLEDCMFQVVY